jgi:hypothetical protein
MDLLDFRPRKRFYNRIESRKGGLPVGKEKDIVSNRYLTNRVRWGAGGQSN